MSYNFSTDWFSHNVPQFEALLADLRGSPCRLLEIGSHEGRSATWLIDHIVTHPAAHLDMIDACEHPSLRANLAASRWPDKATFHLGLSADVLRTLPVDSYDFVYIDGCHWTIETLEDAVLAFRLIKSGGIIAFDDYKWDDPALNQEGRPKEAIDAFLAVYEPKIELLHRGYQVWIRKKHPSEITGFTRSNHPSSLLRRWLRQPRKSFIALVRSESKTTYVRYIP